jgi:hypothetical protein
MMLQLVERIDPFTKAGAEFIATGTHGVGTEGGDKFTAQRQLDIYNQARLALFSAVKNKYPEAQLVKELSNCLTRALLQSTVNAPGGLATLTPPAGFLREHSIYDLLNAPIIILNPIMRPTVLSDSVAGSGHWRQMLSAHWRYMYLQKSTNYVFEGDDIPSSTFTNGEVMYLYYYGLPTWVLADVTGGSTLENIGLAYEQKVLDIAEKIALEVGSLDLTKVAESIV